MTRYNPDSSIDCHVYEGDHAYSSYQEAVDREEDARRENELAHAQATAAVDELRAALDKALEVQKTTRRKLLGIEK